MLKRLEGEGLIERGEHKEAILTASGRVRAERVVRKHRLIERMLTDFMGYTAAESHVHADELGDALNDDMVERIAERLGHPDAARTGGRSTRPSSRPRTGNWRRWRHRAGDARRSSGSPSTTATCSTGSTTRGSRPGPRSRSPRLPRGGGRSRLRVDGEERAVGDKAAGLFVRPAA